MTDTQGASDQTTLHDKKQPNFFGDLQKGER
jgi:hypothetical protein